MPYITIESGTMTADQKKELIERMTAVASEITRIPDEFFMVTINELPDENIGIGGKTIDEIKKQYR
ncbi:MAG: tautomerase family protein [Alistipes sp.]|nr:tautomerase family protein [Alistipes sp.]